MTSVSITLTSIQCLHTSESGNDAVQIVAQADAGLAMRLPSGWTKSYNMDKNQTQLIGQPFTFERDLLITLYDNDISMDHALNDYMISYCYTPNNLPASFTMSNASGAKYTINITRNA